MAQAIRSKKVVSGLTKLSAVQTAQAIYLFQKKKDSHSNGLGYPFKKIVDRLSAWSYLFNEKF